MSRPRLSFCIATLNRARFIGETLECLIAQTTEEVEIVVVDGASTDNTREVVNGFQTRWPRLRYVRLEKKGGVDQDYSRAVELAAGDYCWLFTDDDLIKPGAITAVLAATRDNPSLILVNAEVRTKDFSHQLTPSRVAVTTDQIYEPNNSDRNQLMADAGNYLSFIGAVVIQRALWDQRNKESYMGTEFIHMGVIFQSPLPAQAKLLVHPWITIRYGNAQWVSRHFEIWMLNWPKLIWDFPGIADWAKSRVVPREPWREWRRLLLDRAMGKFGISEFTKWRHLFARSWVLSLSAQLIALAPVLPLNTLARWFVIHVARKNPSIALSDLDAWRNRAPAKH